MGIYNKNPIGMYGNFGACPYPLEISMYAQCSHNCKYCFVSLNRKGEVEGTQDNSLYTVMKTIEKAYSSKYDIYDPVQYFLKHKYPVVISNRTDAFQPLEKKHKLTKKVVKTLIELAIPYNIETKGNEILYSDEYLFIIENAMQCNVGLTSVDETWRKKTEPGTMPISERIELIKHIRKHNNYTTVMVQPYYINKTSSELTEILDAVKECGVTSVSVDVLNERSSKKIPPFMEIKYLIDDNVEIYCCHGNFKETKGFHYNLQVAMSVFHNLLRDKENQYFTFKDFDDIMSKHSSGQANLMFKKNKLSFLNPMRRTAHNLTFNSLPKIVSIKDYIRYLYNILFDKTGLVFTNHVFTPLVDDSGKYIKDKNGVIGCYNKYKEA